MQVVIAELVNIIRLANGLQVGGLEK
jgi:hypothetical protein